MKKTWILCFVAACLMASVASAQICDDAPREEEGDTAASTTIPA